MHIHACLCFFKLGSACSSLVLLVHAWLCLFKLDRCLSMLGGAWSCLVMLVQAWLPLLKIGRTCSCSVVHVHAYLFLFMHWPAKKGIHFSPKHCTDRILKVLIHTQYCNYQEKPHIPYNSWPPVSFDTIYEKTSQSADFFNTACIKWTKMLNSLFHSNIDKLSAGSIEKISWLWGFS